MLLQKALTYEWRFLRGRQTLPNCHEEHGHGEQSGNPKCHFLPRVARDEEDEQSCAKKCM